MSASVLSIPQATLDVMSPDEKIAVGAEVLNAFQAPESRLHIQSALNRMITAENFPLTPALRKPIEAFIRANPRDPAEGPPRSAARIYTTLLDNVKLHVNYSAEIEWLRTQIPDAPAPEKASLTLYKKRIEGALSAIKTLLKEQYNDNAAINDLIAAATEKNQKATIAAENYAHSTLGLALQMGNAEELAEFQKIRTTARSELTRTLGKDISAKLCSFTDTVIGSTLEDTLVERGYTREEHIDFHTPTFAKVRIAPSGSRLAQEKTNALKALSLPQRTATGQTIRSAFLDIDASATPATKKRVEAFDTSIDNFINESMQGNTSSSTKADEQALRLSIRGYLRGYTNQTLDLPMANTEKEKSAMEALLGKSMSASLIRVIERTVDKELAEALPKKRGSGFAK